MGKLKREIEKGGMKINIDKRRSTKKGYVNRKK
jgi:hypothetical protein